MVYYICFNFNTYVRLPTEGDGVCEYSVQLLRMCCLCMEFAEAIREGDGGRHRVLRCWKYLYSLTNTCKSKFIRYQIIQKA